MNKEEILKNLLNKILNQRLQTLEKKSIEEINSLQMTDKQFKDFNKQIFNLKLNYEKSIIKESNQTLNISKTISASPKKSTFLTPKKMIRSKTSNSKFQSGSSTRSNTNTIKKNHPKITQSFQLNMNSISNKKPIKKPNNINYSFTFEQFKSNKNMNLRAKTVTQRNTISNTSNRRNINNNNGNKKLIFKKLNKSMMVIRPTKPHEIQAEIFDIQEQIKRVENVVGNAERIKRVKTSPIKFKKKIIDLSKFFINIDDSDIIIYNIVKFCNKTDSINLISLNKKNCKKSRFKFFEDKIKEILNKDIDEELEEIEKEHEEELKSEIPKFQLSRGSIKAIELLNDDLYVKLFFDNDLPKNFNDIIIIYRILAQLIRNDNLMNIKNDRDFWREICTWFILEGRNKLGHFLTDLSKQFDFSKENIKIIKGIVNRSNNKIVPAIFSKICVTTGLIVFIIKDALEYCGIIINEKKTPIKIIYENLAKEKDKIKILEEIQMKIKNI